MNISTERRFATIIAKKNTEIYIKRKIFIGFALLIALGTVCGIAFFDAVYRGTRYDTLLVDYHFLGVFDGCETYTDYFSVILSVSKPDIRNLFFICVSGFTYFCFPAAGAMVFAKGFLNGFAVFCLFEIISRQPNFDTYKSILVIFVISKFLLSIIAVHLAMSSYIFSYKFREIKSSGSVLRRAPITYRYAFIFIYSVGGVLLVNYLYCFLIYNIIK